MTLTMTMLGDAKTAATVADALTQTGDIAIVSEGNDPVSLPRSLRDVLTAAARAFADGKEIVIGASDTYLTTQDAADYLGVSRPTMVKLLETGEVPFERPNSHRRVRLGDLAAYEAQERARRRKVLHQMNEDFADLSRQPESFTATR